MLWLFSRLRMIPPGFRLAMKAWNRRNTFAAYLWYGTACLLDAPWEYCSIHAGGRLGNVRTYSMRHLSLNFKAVFFMFYFWQGVRGARGLRGPTGKSGEKVNWHQHVSVTYVSALVHKLLLFPAHLLFFTLLSFQGASGHDGPPGSSGERVKYILPNKTFYFPLIFLKHFFGILLRCYTIDP